MDVLVLRLSFSFLVVSCMYGRVEGCGGCAVKPMITPSRMVLLYGSPLSANCSMCGNDFCYDKPKWEVPIGTFTMLNTTLDNGLNKPISQWHVDRATEWSMAPQCYVVVDDAACCTHLDVTLYKRPDNVSISFVNHTGPLLEGRQYTLQCHVQDVAPVQNLTVTFYRGDAMLGRVQSSRNSMKTPVTETFHININSSGEDDGVQYRCEAKLVLGPQGPQPPPVISELTTTVYFKPKMVVASRPDPINITDGETLRLNCTAYSNPSPVYSWIGPGNTTVGNDSVLTVHPVGLEHEGQYVCVASNNQGSTTVTFFVDVSVPPSVAIIAGLVGLVLVIIVVGVALAYNSHHKHTKTGGYKLNRNKGHA